MPCLGADRSPTWGAGSQAPAGMCLPQEFRSHRCVQKKKKDRLGVRQIAIWLTQETYKEHRVNAIHGLPATHSNSLTEVARSFQCTWHGPRETTAQPRETSKVSFLIQSQQYRDMLSLSSIL